MSCKRVKNINDKVLCMGDLNYEVGIYSRVLGLTEPGADEVSELAEVAFTLIANVMTGIETIDGVSRFGGVNLHEKATHLFYIMYSSRFSKLEHGNNFIKFRSEYYKILKSDTYNESRQFIVIQCTDRGDASEKEAMA